MNAKISKQGFSLIETLLYLAILSVVGAVMTGILTNVVRISVRETAGNEVTSQLNSVMQNINSLVRQSSNIEIATSTTVTTLKLRMNDKAKDPTCVYISSNIIKLAQGPDATNPQNCTSATSDLTTSKVTADRLNFQKITYYPGHDTVSVSIQLSYNSTNPQAQISRALQTTIGRVSAATFDDNLIPGTNNTFDLGFSGNSWRNAYFSGNAYFPGSGIWNSSGNVGIGTTGPTAKLNVVASTNGMIAGFVGGNAAGIYPTFNSGYLNFSQNFSGGLAEQDIWNTFSPASYANTGIRFLQQTGVSSYTDLMFLKNNGNVGIGTTIPAGTFHVSNASSTNALVIGAAGTAYGGNVGIGTTTPSYRFDVHGPDQADTYGSWASSQNLTGVPPDICDGNTVSPYTCPSYISKSCTDIANEYYYGEDYFWDERFVTCYGGTAARFKGDVLVGDGNVGIGTVNPDEALTLAYNKNLLLESGNIQTPYGGFGDNQNLITYSEQFNNAVWTDPLNSITQTANNAVAPNRTNTADTVKWDIGNRMLRQLVTLTDGSTYRFSMWVRLSNDISGGSLSIDASDGPSVNFIATSIWKRHSVTIIAGAYNWIDILHGGTSGFEFWGAQLETGSITGVYATVENAAISTRIYGVIGANLDCYTTAWSAATACATEPEATPPVCTPGYTFVGIAAETHSDAGCGVSSSNYQKVKSRCCRVL